MEILLFVLAYVIPLILVLIGRNMNDFKGSLLVTIYNVVYFILLNNLQVSVIDISLMALTYFISSFIAFKIANILDSDSKLAYIIEWSIAYAVPYMLFMFLFSQIAI